jgi:hypothetical protein
MSAEHAEHGFGTVSQGSLPLMDRSTSFYGIFKSAPDKQERLKQLERALLLFVKVLKTHEENEHLKASKIQEANKSVNAPSSQQIMR